MRAGEPAIAGAGINTSIMSRPDEAVVIDVWMTEPKAPLVPDAADRLLGGGRSGLGW